MELSIVNGLCFYEVVIEDSNAVNEDAYNRWYFNQYEHQLPSDEIKHFLAKLS